MDSDKRMKQRFWLMQLLGIVMFIVGVMACYGGARGGAPWMGPLVVSIIVGVDFALSAKNRVAKAKLLAAVILLGFLAESALITLSLYTPSPASRWVMPVPLSPLWILALWLNFGTRIPSYLLFLRGRHLINATIGFVFAFLIFRSAARMGVLELHHGLLGFTGIAVVWAILVPVLYQLGAHWLMPANIQKESGGEA